MNEKKLTMGVLLPHTKLYGGVKRFLELGNEFVKLGHQFIVFTPDGEAPEWFEYNGKMATFEELKEQKLDALFTTTVKYMDIVLASNARHKIFYHVRKTEKIKHIVNCVDAEIYACSGNVYELDSRRYPSKHIEKAFGGVNVGNYKPVDSYAQKKDNPFIVMAYGRLAEKVKGTKYVVRACERLYKKGYNIKLLLYDTPTGEKGRRLIDEFSCKCPFEFVVGHPFNRNAELFGRANVFVSAENPRYSGWNNTVAEAMACALPIVATEAGTYDLLSNGETGLLAQRRSKDIAKKIAELYNDVSLREKLGKEAYKHIKTFDWRCLAAEIENKVIDKDE